MSGMCAALVFLGLVVVVAADNATTTITTTMTTTTFQAKTTTLPAASTSKTTTLRAETTTIATSSPESTTAIVGKLGVAVDNTSFIMDGGSNQADFTLGVQRSIADAGNIADESMVAVTLTTARRLQAFVRQLQSGTIQVGYTVVLAESMGPAAQSNAISALRAVTADTFTATLSAKLETIMGADAPSVVVSVIDVPTQDISDSTTTAATEPVSDGAQKGGLASMLYALVVAGLVAAWLM